MLRILLSDKEGWKEGFIKAANPSKYQLTFSSFTESLDVTPYDLILPLTIADQRFLLDHFPDLQGLKYFVPSNEVINLCNDKLALNRQLTNMGLEDFIPEFGDYLPLPYILKKRIDRWGENCHMISTVEDEKTHRSKLGHDDYFRQVPIFGKNEYTTHFIFWKNEIIFDLTLEFNYADPIFIKGIKKPTTESKIKVVKQRHSKTFSNILSSINYSGIGCINYKVENFAPKIFEINPRIGASLTLGFEKLVEAVITKTT